MSLATVDPNAELRAAQAALQQGRHPDAAVHLGRVIPEYAIHPAITGLLDQLIGSAPNPLALVPSGPAEYGTAAVHAYALGKVGRVAEAYGILRQLANATPANGIIDWALPWLGGLDGAHRDEAILLFLASTQPRFNKGNDPSPESLAILRQWLPHVRATMTGRPDDDPLYGLYIPLLRHVGEMEEALRIVRARYAANPSYQTAVSLAATLRAVGDYAGFLAVSLEVLTFAPDNVFVRLDLGDCSWDNLEKLDEAETWYADALRLAPDQEWATPSLLAVRYLRTHELSWLEQLEDYAAAHPENQRAGVCVGRVTPFFADFIYPADASINNLKQIADQVDAAVASGQGGPLTGTIAIAITGLDVPSCQQSIDRQLALWGGGIKLERTTLGMQSPDPREPRVPVQYRLWEYDDRTPRPAVAPPPPEVAERIAALARTRYGLWVWCDHADDVASQLGAASCAGLLGVMAFPPDAPSGWRIWDWTARVQVAAALVLAVLAQEDGAPARQALIDLANGPLDWTTVAAVVALTTVAVRQPGFAPEVRPLFAAVYNGLPCPGANYYEYVLLNCHLRLPGLPPEERAAVRAERRNYDARTRQHMTDAEVAARIFLARPRPDDIGADDMVRTVIQAFANNIDRDHPGFPGALRGSLLVTEALLASAEGERKAYFEEQASVLRRIEAETQPVEAENAREA